MNRVIRCLTTVNILCYALVYNYLNIEKLGLVILFFIYFWMRVIDLLKNNNYGEADITC
jgi:hypothetical protein